MLEVEVLINNFKDLKVYNARTKVIRNGKEVELQYRLLQKGDIYKIDKSRYKILSEKGYVKKTSKEKSTQIEEVSKED